MCSNIKPEPRIWNCSTLCVKLILVQDRDDILAAAGAEPLISPPVTVILPTPNSPPWGAPVAIGVWIASILAIVIFPSLVLFPYLATRGVQFGDNAEVLAFLQADPTAVLLQVLAVIPAHAATILLAWLVVTKGRKFSFRQTLGWQSGGIVWWHYIAIIVGFFIVAAIAGHYMPEEENDLMRILRSSRAAVFAVAVMATFTAPLVEEVVYRGVLYSAFQRTAGMVPAVILVTFLFAVVHVPQYYPSVSTILLLTLLSLILTLIRARTGNLLPCIVLHTIFNGLQSVALILEPYLPTADAPTQGALFHLLK